MSEFACRRFARKFDSPIAPDKGLINISKWHQHVGEELKGGSLQIVRTNIGIGGTLRIRNGTPAPHRTGP